MADETNESHSVMVCARYGDQKLTMMTRATAPIHRVLNLMWLNVAISEDCPVVKRKRVIDGREVWLSEFDMPGCRVENADGTLVDIEAPTAEAVLANHEQEFVLVATEGGFPFTGIHAWEGRSGGC